MAETEQPKLEINTSRQFTSWLAEKRISISVTTYQSGKLFLFGLQPDGRLSVFERTLNRTMGMVGDDQTLWISSLYQLWRFENALAPGESHNGFDRLFVPQVGITTGDIDIHDMGIDSNGQPIFVTTAFSCLATPSDTHSFKPLWKPPFIGKIAGEDRCHLNGLAMRDGEPGFVTAVGVSDMADGWRDQRVGGGIVMDVPSGEIVCEGLTMPHSPRLYRDLLWVLNSGEGDLGIVTPESGKFEPVAWLPGYARGLAFVDEFAVIGLSSPRDGSKTFQGLPLDDRLAEKNGSPWCAIAVIDLKTFDMVHWLRFEGVVQELYDVAVLPNAVRPMALGFKSDEIRRMLTIEPE